MRETGEIAAGTLHGDKLYERRARSALPLLVRHARAEQPVFYSDLADELGMPNPRNLNYVLGAIGNALLDLSSEWGFEVPPIQALVINKGTGLPGEGLAWFAPDAAEFRNASSKRKRELVGAMLQKVYAFERWNEVLSHFSLSPVRVPLPALPSHPIYDGDPGESEEHRRFKEFVARNPQVVGLPRSCPTGEVEYLFASADAVDVLFKYRGEWIGVEVKSVKSSPADITRGLFQCVKYRALLEATQMVAQLAISCRTVLALEGELPKELLPLRNTLGVDVRDKINPSPQTEVVPLPYVV
jgi:hypothetical protein